MFQLSSFNPCFAGSCFSTSSVKEYRIILTREVSILVLLEAVFQPRKTKQVQSEGAQFQSLFCWKLFFNIKGVLQMLKRVGVSILVLLEAVFQPYTTSQAQVARGIVSILVLLEAVFQQE
ncbi:hypothetical protein [Methanosarcina lacustris]